MIWIRFVLFALIVLLIAYWGNLIFHILGKTVMTHRRITFVKCLIPFYYWIADPNVLD